MNNDLHLHRPTPAMPVHDPFQGLVSKLAWDNGPVERIVSWSPAAGVQPSNSMRDSELSAWMHSLEETPAGPGEITSEQPQLPEPTVVGSSVMATAPGAAKERRMKVADAREEETSSRRPTRKPRSAQVHNLLERVYSRLNLD